MRKSHLVWVVVVLIVAGVAAVMIPGSPFALENTVGDPVAIDYPEGHVPQLSDESKAYPTRTLRAWTADLSSPDVAVRRKALNAIGTIAPLAAKSALPVAKVLADDPDPALREKASQILYRMGAGAKPALPQVTAALASDNAVVRRNAVLYMMTLKTDARSAVPALVAAMSDPRNEDAIGYPENTQVVAASALGGVSAGAADAVPGLTEVVSSTRPVPLRTAAARALGMIGQPAKPAVPALTAMLNTLDKTDYDNREHVTVALQALGEHPPEVNRPKTDRGGYNKAMGGGDKQDGPPKKDDAPADKKGGPPKG